MNFADAVQSVFRQYANFNGRARRSEFWWYQLFSLIIGIVIAIIDNAAGTVVIGLLVDLALILPSLAVLARRLHDTDRSAWWIFIGLIPLVGLIILIVFACQDSNLGANSHGASPKYPNGGPGGGYPGYPPPGGYPGYPPQQGYQQPGPGQGYPPPPPGY